MKFTTALDHVALLARDLPNNPWSMAAFAAAASIMVTLVTVYLWPNGETAAPTREATTAAGVQRLARQGVDASDIARTPAESCAS